MLIEPNLRRSALRLTLLLAVTALTAGSTLAQATSQVSTMVSGRRCHKQRKMHVN